VFVTMPPFEQLMPANMVGPDQQYWRAVTLSLEAPWYLFVYEAQYGQQKVPQTTLVAWEVTLLDILEAVPVANRMGVARIEKEPGSGNRWNMSWVETIWAPAQEESEQTGPFLLQLTDDAQVRDAHLQPVVFRNGRELVYRAPSKPTHQSPTYTPIKVPIDFPEPVSKGVMPGVRPQLGVHEDDDTLTDDAEEKRVERYCFCQDLVNQLVECVKQKRVVKSDADITKLVAQVLKQKHKKQLGWDLSTPEADWISGRVGEHFGFKK
jgi:hypothetical protein